MGFSFVNAQLMRIILLSVTLVLVHLNSYGQTELRRFTVTPTEAPRSVAVFPDFPDKAALIFESSLTNLLFDSQMNGILEVRDESSNGRYILIIEPFTQVISISASGFIQERLRVGGPVAREVRYFRIDAEQRSPDRISVIFNVSPSDARLFVDNQQTESNQAVQLEPGPRQIRIEREGYRSLDERVVVSATNISFTYRLAAIDIVAVNIMSNVPGARVSIDGTERGQIDRAGGLGLFLFPGSYALNVSLTGYVAQNRTIEVRETGSNDFRVDIVPNIGELALLLTPSDARVSVNRQDYTGQAVIELAPGRYRLDVEKEGFAPHTETVDIALNARVRRTIALEAYLGGLQFTVTPSNAQVELINTTGQVVNRWTGIQLLRNVQAGSYILRIIAPNYTTLEERIEIKRDETTQISIALLEGGLCGDFITDADGNKYKSIQIGEQCWMAENLNTTRYRDGTLIANVTNDSQWGGLASGGRSYYRNNQMLGSVYGSLYNWYAVIESKSICPVGWHVPSDVEWTELTNFLGRNAGGKMKNRGTQNWRSPNTGATNVSGFSALPGGSRNSTGAFFNSSSNGIFWSSTENSSGGAWSWGLSYNSENINRTSSEKRSGFSVRCVRD
jgi:uncharacterized protein (TIGR02145 family)